MANPRYNQPERQSGRERKLSELGSLLQLSNASQAPMLEQQQLQQREQAAKQNMMMQFMQMMNEQQGQRQRAEQSAGQLDLGNRDLVQRQAESDRRGKDTELVGLLDLIGRGDPIAKKVYGQRVPEYGQELDRIHQGEVRQKVAGTLPAIQGMYAKPGSDLPQRLGLEEAKIDPEIWNAMPWDQLNASLTAPQASQGVPAFLEPILNGLTIGNYNTVKQLPGVMQHLPNFPQQGHNPQHEKEKQAAMARAMQKLMLQNGLQ